MGPLEDTGALANAVGHKRRITKDCADCPEVVISADTAWLGAEIDDD
jgi:hypothetical protein